MKRQWMIIMVVVLLGGIYAYASEKTPNEAAINPDQPQKHWHQMDADWLNEFHNPAPGVRLGLDFRFRTEHGKNWLNYDDQFGDTGHNPSGSTGNKNYWNYQRYRTRLWSSFDLSEDVTVNARLVWEFFVWRDPADMPQDTDFNEVLFDQLNVTWKNAFDMPITLVIGRQDIILGNGWLVLDGTPLDNSRTIFFDAVRATINCSESNTKYDLIYINNQANLNHRIKPFNDQHAPVMEQDEQGFIFQASNSSIENTTIDGYYIYKADEDIKSIASIADTTRDASLHTIGARVNGMPDTNWEYYLEGAHQWGKKDMNTVKAWGANSSLAYKFNDQNSNRLRVGYEFLSGDNPNTSTDESFDLLWGRWARWSEMYIYSFAMEPPGRIAQVTNMHRANIGHTFVPAKNWSVDTDYHLIWADENTYADCGDFSKLSHSGRFRGQLLTCWLKYSCCENLKLHWLAEYFQPGDYYDRVNRDYALFLRFNIEYTF